MRRAVLTGLVALLSGCGGGGEGASPPPLVPVTLATVRRDSISATVTVVGRLAPVPGGSALLTAPTDAVVRRVAVQVGDRVGAGGLLVELDAPELETRARAMAAAADAAEADLKRQRDLYAQGITARRQLEEREAAAVSARSEAHAARALLARTRVVSPIAGAVQQVLVQPGELVASGQPLSEVVNGSRLDLVASVAPKDLAGLRVGQAAEVRGEAGTAVVPARVRAIAPGVDSVSSAGRVVIRLDRPGPGLRPGGGATATVRLGLEHDVLIVPPAALVLQGDSTAVFVVGPDSIAHAVPVQTGARSGERVQIRGAVEAGARVVTVGAYGLADGMKVVPTAPDSVPQ